MVEVAGRPFLDHQLTLLRRNGIRRVVLCVGHLCEQIEEYLGDGFKLGLQVSYSRDGERLLGTGGALRRAAHLLDDVFWVLYGDSYLNVDYSAILDHFNRVQADGLMTVYDNGDRWDKSNVVFRNGQLLSYDKRSPLPEMAHIDYGLLLLRRQVIASIPADQPCDLADLLHRLSVERRLAGLEVFQRFYEIGSPAGLAETEQYLSSHAA